MNFIRKVQDGASQGFEEAKSGLHEAKETIKRDIPSPSKPGMPSKGIKCYAYICVGDTEIEFYVPNGGVTKRDPDKFTEDHLEVDSRNLDKFKFTGRFGFKVRRQGRELAHQWVDVNSMTGALEDGTMKTMDQTPSIFVEDLLVVYGFYDAGPGIAGLPKQHQCWVTVTRNYENWMREVVPRGADQENHPFRKMVLPSSHDIGMNSMQTALAMLQHAGTDIIKEVIGRSLPHAFDIFNKVSDSAINHIAPDIIRALAITQKDSLDTVLKIGARYFEFRPAHCHRQMQRVSPLEDTVYFQHGAIPGMLYRAFLHDIIEFLVQHGDEIVVVQLRWDGVPGDCPRPSDDELNNILNDEMRDKDLAVGNQDDMRNLSIRDLRDQRKRLIVTRDVDQVSNYDDTANATLDGVLMVNKLNDMCNDLPQGHVITLLQCQATATNIRDVIVASVLDSDVSTSPLLATKAICDKRILPLMAGEAGTKFCGVDNLVVVLNDFFCGATADVAIRMCRDRIGW